MESIEKTITGFNRVELLFYVDEDDETFPELRASRIIVKKFVGPRVWISNAQNFLAMNATGEILMTAGDDMVFKTFEWDHIVSQKFMNIEDKIGLVFGNDLGTHAGTIATHGFFHKTWFQALGTWVQPGRGSLWDLWSTENARILGRLFYIESLVIEHLHFRQSHEVLNFDKTYEYAGKLNASFRPIETYNKMKRERRIDRLILRNYMKDKPPIEPNYLIAETLVKSLLKNKSLVEKTRVLTLTNFSLLLLILRKLFRIK
jgi:hypothetical protein